MFVSENFVSVVDWSSGKFLSFSLLFGDESGRDIVDGEWFLLASGAKISGHKRVLATLETVNRRCEVRYVEVKDDNLGATGSVVEGDIADTGSCWDIDDLFMLGLGWCVESRTVMNDDDVYAWGPCVDVRQFANEEEPAVEEVCPYKQTVREVRDRGWDVCRVS